MMRDTGQEPVKRSETSPLQQCFDFRLDCAWWTNLSRMWRRFSLLLQAMKTAFPQILICFYLIETFLEPTICAQHILPASSRSRWSDLQAPGHNVLTKKQNNDLLDPPPISQGPTLSVDVVKASPNNLRPSHQCYHRPRVPEAAPSACGLMSPKTLRHSTAIKATMNKAPATCQLAAWLCPLIKIWISTD